MTLTTHWTTLRRAPAVVGITGLTLVGLALFGTAGTAGAQTYAPAPSASFSDATPEPGQTVAVSGSAAASSTVSITLARPDGTIVTLGTVTADASGSFSLNITLPSDLVDGNYVIAAVNGTTILSSSAFAVGGATTQGDITPAPSAATNPTGGGAAAAAAAQTTTLPVTGLESALLAWGGAGFIVLGGAALVISTSRLDAEAATLDS